MNKKFSTLMAGFLLTSAFSSAQISLSVDQLKKVEDDKTIQAGGTFFIIESSDDDLDANDQIFAATLGADGKVQYSSYAFSTYANNQNSTKENLLWNLGVKETTDGLGGTSSYYYTLQNVKTESYLSVDGKSPLEVIKDVVEAPLHGKKADGTATDVYSYFATTFDDGTNKITQGAALYSQSENNTSNRLQATQSGDDIVVNGDPSSTKKLLFCVYKTQEADIKLLNQTMGGEGFALTFNKIKDYEENVFATTPKFKAFKVMSALKVDMGDEIVHEIPAGTYLATEYPEALNGVNEITSSEQFMACYFPAANPATGNDRNPIDATKGNGFELAVVAGSAMNYVKDNTLGEAYIPGETYVGNACFTIEIPNFISNEEAYQFKLPTIRVQGKAADKKWTVVTYVYVASHKELETLFVVTNKDIKTAITFTATNSSIFQPKKLLSTVDAPSVYTIRFVSGEDKEGNSEYGQYLTAGVSSGFALYSMAEEGVENDPMYQFVITKVDTTKKVVTFTNRQVKGLSFETSLYTIDEENLIFKTLSENVNAFIAIDNNGKIAFSLEALSNKEVQLSPVSVENQFATFDAAKNINGLVTFELGMTQESDNKLYVVAPRDAEDKDVVVAGRLQASEDFADQFELVQAQVGNDKPRYVWNPYVFVKANGEVATSTKRDTVAYNTYKIKLFAPESTTPYYVDKNSSLNGDASKAQEYIIKTNLDGSVSLIKGNDVDVFTATYEAVNATKEKDNAWTTKDYYKLADVANSAKTFMVTEPEAISLAATPQHVSFESVRGGFISMDANKDASLAIATEASEALTLWVDTVKSDEIIPSFYIAHAGHYLYYAEDSVNTLNGEDKYKLEGGDVKLIFKAAELVSSDTLKTVVEGKEVLVAEKANRLQKVAGGLNNFQFQIIKDEEGSDEYVIRKTGTYQYVREINGLLALTNTKKAAARFYIESQSAPTANEGIATSEVKVIAGEGNVTIAGAAGKKVVISNILGQVVANTVISSDNAVIAAPAGVVVVAVEGEAAVKAIVK